MAKKEPKLDGGPTPVDETPATEGQAIPGPGFKGHELPPVPPQLDTLRMYAHGPASVVAAFRTSDGTLYEVPGGVVDVRPEHIDTAQTFGFSASAPTTD